ncbi:hypothetical protein GW17_00015115 [Ensete ventricosum]|nr:hypothetical protein GW17_00015115 [Ensete ventricosum]
MQFCISFSDGKKFTISYPCVMLNIDVARNNTNDQYQAEGILIKKRYAVFNYDGTLAELKGFEIKRRGELKLIKVFQLSTMSKSLVDYGEQKSCAVTTAKRLADFLGDAMVKDKGLHCQYIVAREPQGTPVSERAIPVAIFETDAGMVHIDRLAIGMAIGMVGRIDRPVYSKNYHHPCCNAKGLNILVEHFLDLLSPKPNFSQVSNPVPRVVHPDWLHKKVCEKEDRFRQRKLVDIFNTAKRDQVAQDETTVGDIEEISVKDGARVLPPRPVVHTFEVNREINSRKPSSPVSGMPVDLQEQHLTLFGSNQSLVSSSNNGISSENVDKTVDYQAWLETKKRKWKDSREERKRRRIWTGLIENFLKYEYCHIMGYVNVIEGTLLSLTWHFLGCRMGSTHISDEPVGTTKFPDSSFNYKHSQRFGVSGFFKKHESSLVRSHWQVEYVRSIDVGSKILQRTLVAHRFF